MKPKALIITDELHHEIKMYCAEHRLKIKEFVEIALRDKMKKGTESPINNI
jgi:hypothetical protein